jgi:hypothetical protein
MIGSYDFCGHYEWTFAWLDKQGGHELVKAYWDEAIRLDSQAHAGELIVAQGIEGMKKYWGHSLEQEAAGCEITATDKGFRIDMHECPSKGFLIRNGLEQYGDYCDHCMGWIGPLMKAAGFVIDHEHNHCGQCWWEMRRADLPASPNASEELSEDGDVRLRADWKTTKAIDVFRSATDPDDKTTTHPA